MRNIPKFFAPRTAIFFVMIILLLIFIGQIADIALIMFAAFVVACTMNPLIDKMVKYRIPRVLAVSILLLGLLLIILGILIPLISVCVEQFLVLVKQIPKFLVDIEKMSSIGIFGLQLDEIIDPNAIKAYLTGFSGNVLAQSINATKILANSLTTILAVSIMVFYITTDAKLLREGYLALFPPKFKEKAASILDIIQLKVGGFVWAQLISMIFVGVLTSIGLWMIGHKHMILLGFLTGILDIIPVIGPTIAVAVGIYTSAKFGFWYVILTFVIYMVAQWLQNQLLRPLVFGKLMGMHPLMIIFSILVGAKFLGVWGVILAPAIASVICVLFDELYIKTINAKGYKEPVSEIETVKIKIVEES